MITASELKTKGIRSFKTTLRKQHEAILSVRGKPAFVVMDFDRYNYLRECELEAALHESRQDLAEGRFHTEDVDSHIQRLTDK